MRPLRFPPLPGAGLGLLNSPGRSMVGRLPIPFLLCGALFGLASCDSSSSPTELPEVASIQVTPANLTIEAGSAGQLSAVILDQNGGRMSGQPITWSSGNPQVAAVNSSGIVSGVAAGGPVTVTATSGGRSGSAEVTVTPIPVATVTLTPEILALQLGTTIQLTAKVFDAQGDRLDDREISWSSNDPAIAFVDSSGRVSGLTEGGPVTVTATSEGVSASAMVTVMWTILTGIKDFEGFIDLCPTDDPAYAQIRQDFEIRVDGVLITEPLTCSEPFSEMPIEELNSPMISVQAFRVAYYLGQGTEGHLPWTDKSLYDWMAANIDGVNLRTTPGLFYCCNVIDGKTFIGQSIQSAEQREYKRTFRGISSTTLFFAHEIRHADPTGGQGHTTGCEAFPNPTDPSGCDPSYDLGNLGSYGVQYWLGEGLATGYLNIGIGCLDPAEAYERANRHLIDVNLSYRRRFVENAPPSADHRGSVWGSVCEWRGWMR